MAISRPLLGARGPLGELLVERLQLLAPAARIGREGHEPAKLRRELA
jgi:hypothetical protein